MSDKIKDLLESESSKYSREWEHISDYTWRLKVPDGWLIRDSKNGSAISFFPDPLNRWVLEDKH